MGIKIIPTTLFLIVTLVNLEYPKCFFGQLLVKDRIFNFYYKSHIHN
jgi:hypothetical protein